MAADLVGSGRDRRPITTTAIDPPLPTASPMLPALIGFQW